MGSSKPMRLRRLTGTGFRAQASGLCQAEGFRREASCRLQASEPRTREGVLRGAGQRGRLGAWTTLREDRVIAPMAGDIAGGAFLLDVAQLALGRQLPVAADHAPACKRSKSEEPYQTHMATQSSRVVPGGASHMPLSCSELPESVNAAKSVFTRLSALAGQNARAIRAEAV